MRKTGMNRGIMLLLAVVAMIACAAGAGTNANAGEKLVTLGTAGVTGVYYPAGGAICRLVNRNRKEHGIRCVVESTGGSINNLDFIREGELEMGVAQSDLLYDAYNGNDMFADRSPNTKLRVLFSLHPEPFTVLVRGNSNIKTFDDLKGRKVNLGNPGSGPRATMEELMKAKGWTEKTFASVIDSRSNDQAQSLCNGKVDALIFALGHPNGAVSNITSMCEARLIGVSGAEVDALIKRNPFYSYTTIPGGMYPGNPNPVKTFGVRAVVVTSEDMDDDVAYRIVSAVFDNLDNFKTLHPVFANLDAKQMADGTEKITPLHEGAKRYFMEKGLLP